MNRKTIFNRLFVFIVLLGLSADGIFANGTPNTPTPVPVNNAPIGNNQYLSTLMNQALAIQLSGYDWEGSPLTFGINIYPLHGALTGLNPSTGAVTYTPNADFFGTDLFYFSISDGSLASEGTVQIEVINPNPTATPTAPIPTPTSTFTPTPTEPAPTDTPTEIPTEVPTAVPEDTPTLEPTPTDTPVLLPTDTPTFTPTPTPTETNTPTATYTPTPTNTPRPGNRAPKVVTILAKNEWDKNEDAVLSVQATDADKDILQVTYSTDAPVTVKKSFSLPGLNTQDLILRTSIPGTFTFSIFAYDGSDATIKDVTYTVIGELEPTSTPVAPTPELPEATPTPEVILDTPTPEPVIPEGTPTPMETVIPEETTPTPTVTPTPISTPTNTPKPENIAPKINLVPSGAITVIQNTGVVLSLMATDKNNDAMQMYVSDDAPVTQMSFVGLSGLLFADIVLDTSQVGEFIFIVYVDDGNLISQKQVQLTVTAPLEENPPQ